MIPEETDVAIAGAGPYALSLATHLRALGVQTRVFGPAMKFWLDMPRGINLKSLGFATNVCVPRSGFRFVDWCRARGLEDFEPCPMSSFAAYGLWVKDQLVPDVDPALVRRVSRLGERQFEVVLADERIVRARRVVLATGLSYFAYVPEVLAALPAPLVSHTFDHTDYDVFRGLDVAVVGGGASALEAGALVHESGGRAQVLVRDEASFSTKMSRNRPLLARLRAPNSVLGPGLKSWALEKMPMAFWFLPERQRVHFVKTHLGPKGPWWIKDRLLGHVPVHDRTSIVGAERAGDRVRLRVRHAAQGERTVEVDRVIAGTGYVVDVDRIEYLDPALRAGIRRVEKSPALSLRFESSVPGLYFLGLAAAMSFGPLFRFVAGAEFAAPALARHLAGARAPRMRRVAEAQPDVSSGVP